MKRVRLDEIEPTLVAGVRWRPVRSVLGIEAFGANAYVGDAGDLIVEEHDETSAGAGGHEELYVVLAGRATFTVDDEVVDAPAGTLLLVQPGENRVAHAAEDGTQVLALGGRPGEPYRVSEWEYRFRAWREYEQGRRDEARRLLLEGLDRHPESGWIRFFLAFAAAGEDDREQALAYLTEAVEKNEHVSEAARREAAFDAIRDDPRFPA